MAKRRGASSNTSEEELPKAKLNRNTLKKANRLLQFIGPHKWKFALGMVFLGLTAATALIFPKLMGTLMGLIGGGKSGGMNMPDMDQLKQVQLSADNAKHLIEAANSIGLKLLILFALQAVFSFFRVLLFANVTENMLASVRQATFSKLVCLPMSFFSKNQAAELNSRISADITQIGETLTTGIAEFIRQLVIIIGGVTMICLISWKLALLMLAVVPPIAIIAVFYGRKIRGHSRNVQDRVADSNIIVGESLQGISNVKSFTNESYEIGRYRAATRKIVDAAIRYAVSRGTFFSFIIFCLFGSIILIVWSGVQMTVHHELSAGEMLQFMFYTLFVSASFGGIPEQYAQIQRAVGASERIMEILDETTESLHDGTHPLSASPRLKGEVVFSHISFHYPTRKDFAVLKDISFEVKTGQTIAIVGPSGSGKSTLAAILLRFYDPVNGTIYFDGKDAKEYDLTELRQNMAIVPQDVLLFGGSIRENIAYGKPGASEEEIIEAAKKANAFEFIASFPDKFDTKVGDRGIQLSGGQRQRIAIARAVLKNPSILILDEATSSLDSESERVVQEALDKLMVGRTSFVIAHRLSTIRNADRIVVIEKGIVKETGTHTELMQQEDGLYRSLSQMQFREPLPDRSLLPKS
jgi:ABC-type multidrug transport system fused ATPase/permease subunit